MSQYWIKPMGVTKPQPDPTPNDWLQQQDLDRLEIRTGPSTASSPPQIGAGDLVILHAVIYARIFAAVEILDNPRRQADPDYGERWPWLYPCRAICWVPLIEEGPPSRDAIPRRAIGRLQRGGEYAKLDPIEYDVALAALRAQPGAKARARSRSRPRATRGTELPPP